MKILVYGAGVLGSLYAAKLKEAGNEVSILARGNRADEIRSNGIVLENAAKGKRSITIINVVEVLSPNDVYDLILVLIPKHQISSIKPILSANKNSSTILFMLNNPSGFDEWIQTVGKERFLAGFPGGGGKRENGIVRYRLLPGFMQPTTIGEYDGKKSDRVAQIALLFRNAGFPTAVSSNIDAWLRYHVAWIGPMMNAIYMAGGDGPSLAGKRDVIVLMIKAIRESFSVLKQLGYKLTPPVLRLMWQLYPPSVISILFKRILKTTLFDDVAGGHAKVVYPEFKQLSEEFQILARSSNLSTPALDELHDKLGSFDEEFTYV